MLKLTPESPLSLMPFQHRETNKLAPLVPSQVFAFGLAGLGFAIAHHTTSPDAGLPLAVGRFT